MGGLTVYNTPRLHSWDYSRYVKLSKILTSSELGAEN